MSRSFRMPIATHGYGSKWKSKAKRLANKVVRKTQGAISDGGSFKKVFRSYAICDFKFEIMGNQTKARAK
ncbi:hypothetical protein [Bdellovibrio sp. BCCA]|uniref:hypothetical protein n=1 Tax=Bdellovibrio sp. BCCA TaxID=3136281 RepID=UPI0030F2B6D7